MESSWRDREGEATRADKRKSGGGPNNARCLLRDADSSGLMFFEMAKEPNLTRSFTRNYCLICSSYDALSRPEQLRA
ncbi:hypothetical protein NC651_032025 [Populus alba x Populus x berolinensis]|nr:hypothetical protein NC651_032025 [Populus alba x Populus x berolinensis]